MSLPNCPKCNSEYVYEDGLMLVCPECAYEWNPADSVEEDGLVVIDNNGTRLADGDSVTIVKNLKVKGAYYWFKFCNAISFSRYFYCSF